MGMVSALASVFSTGEDILDYSNIKLDAEHREALKSVERGETKVNEAFNSNGGGKNIKFDSKYKNNLEKMAEKLRGNNNNIKSGTKDGKEIEK